MAFKNYAMVQKIFVFQDPLDKIQWQKLQASSISTRKKNLVFLILEY